MTAIMTIDEAIKTLDDYQSDLVYDPEINIATAIKMGVAALSRIRYQRLKPTEDSLVLLPGEGI